MFTNRIRRYFEQPRRAPRSSAPARVPEGFASLPPQLLPAAPENLQHYAQLYRDAYEQALRQARNQPR